jgi:hypothetical protein
MALKRDWLDDGSLLILMPHNLLLAWSGIDGSDYDRACALNDRWLVPIEVGGARAFLLGGDPGMALFVPLPESGLGLIRWYYADDEDELVDFAVRRQSVKRTEPDLLFENTEPKWTLFNAAWNPATDSPPMHHAEMPVGNVLADTAFLEAGHNAAIFHRFRRQ